jgi:hypothetical protein
MNRYCSSGSAGFCVRKKSDLPATTTAEVVERAEYVRRRQSPRLPGAISDRGEGLTS